MSAGRRGRRQRAGPAEPPGCVPGPLGLPLVPQVRPPSPPDRPPSGRACRRVSWRGPFSARTLLGTAWPGAPSPSEPGRPVRGASRLRRCSGDRQNPHQPPPQLRPSSGDSANQPGSQMGGREDLRGAPGLGSPREQEAESFQSGRLACGAAGSKASASPPLPLPFPPQ